MAQKAPEKIDSQSRNYELVIIVTPTGGEEILEEVVNRVSEQITAGGGEIVSVDRWGKKKLAYPIKHHLEGSYALFNCKIKPERTRELESGLDIAEDVLRHILVSLDS
jgi:small subunit ribosomal protein S6